MSQVVKGRFSNAQKAWSSVRSLFWGSIFLKLIWPHLSLWSFGLKWHLPRSWRWSWRRSRGRRGSSRVSSLRTTFFKLHFLLSCTPFLSFFLFFISNSFVSDVPGMIYRTLKMYFWKQLVHSRHLFISVFAKHLIVNQIPDDWIRTADLWCWKQPLYQLRHNPVQSWRYFKLPIKQSPNFDFIFF